MLIDSTRRALTGERGSVLLEGLIAILIFSLGVLGLVGLQASSMRATTQAKGRIDASLVANQLIARMWVDRANLAGYIYADEDVKNLVDTYGWQSISLPSGKITSTVVGDKVTVKVTWQMPAEGTSTFETIANINGN